MNKYIKEFIRRGLIFGGLGPMVVGIVFMIIDFSGEELNIHGWQILLAIASTYLIAFIQAGSSVFEQIDEWTTAKSLFVHMFSIYVAYLVTYLINSWIPFKPIVIMIFSGAVIVGFLIIWLTVFLFTKRTKEKLNNALSKK